MFKNKTYEADEQTDISTGQLTLGLACVFYGWLYTGFFLFLGKKKNKKGKTLTLTDFLAEDSGGSGVAPSYPTKTTSWADETDDLDGDGELALKYTLSPYLAYLASVLHFSSYLS